MENKSRKFVAEIRDGKIIFQDKVYSEMFLTYMEGETVNVSLSPLRYQRSNQQNKYYFGVVIELIADHTGYSHDEVHEILAYKFLKSSKDMDSETVEYIRSTSDLNTLEFEDYLKKIREWASIKLQVFIPHPNETLEE